MEITSQDKWDKVAEAVKNKLQVEKDDFKKPISQLYIDNVC